MFWGRPSRADGSLHIGDGFCPGIAMAVWRCGGRPTSCRVSVASRSCRCWAMRLAPALGSKHNLEVSSLLAMATVTSDVQTSA